MTFLSCGKGGENALCKVTVLHFGLLTKVVDHITVNIWHTNFDTQIVSVFSILQGQHISAISP